MLMQRSKVARADVLDSSDERSEGEAFITAGPYTGELRPQYCTTALLDRLAELPSCLALPSARLVAGGRNRHVCIELPINGHSQTVIVKAFGPQPWIKDARDRRRGSKARRTWLAAKHLGKQAVGTPPPIGYLERWERGRLRESYFLAVYQHRAESFREALLRLYHETPECARFMHLLECVAAGVSRMHAAGFLHNDLGNQNILLTPEGPDRWRDMQVIDLNRGRIRRELSARERARDLSRLDLPSHLRWLFMCMYCCGTPPAALVRWERLHRWLYGMHSRSRRWRHPIRAARQRQQAGGSKDALGYPAPRDIWIWDERSGQAIPALLRGDRLREYPVSRGARMAADTLRAAPSVWREYRALMAGAYRQPVDFSGRIGMALNPSPDTLDRELRLLAGLGRIPAFVRFYHHEGPQRWRFRAQLVHTLHGQGHPVDIALVQDRRAVREPAAWRGFIEEVLQAVANVVGAVEVGHNVNRAKWGIWDFRELRALYAPFAELRARFPALRFTGPGAIDFEYPFLFSALREWPADAPLSALSHHLYVDRRGAPENSQGAFSTVEKLALARAIARSSPRCRDSLVISEVNWPLAGTGAYSPVGSPYALPGQQHGGHGVSEDKYANYMIRYLCLALGSGMAEKVYWWRLVARGYGLVDDSNDAAWRPRPAYGMLRTFLGMVGDSTLVTAQVPAYDDHRLGRYRFAFRRLDGETVVLTYAHGPSLAFPPAERFSHVEDAFGQPLARPPEQLTGRPVYLRAGEAHADSRLGDLGRAGTLVVIVAALYGVAGEILGIGGAVLELAEGNLASCLAFVRALRARRHA